MKIQTIKIAPCKQQIKVSVSSDKLNQKIEKLYLQIAKTAWVPGFRKGKVPRSVLEIHYQKKIKNKAIEEVISDAYTNVLKTSNFVPISPAKISDIKLEKDYLHFQIVVETRPEIKLGKYKGIKLLRKEKVVTEKDIEEELKFLQKMERDSRQKKNKSKELSSIELSSIDDKFAKQFGKDNLEDLRKAIRQNLIRIRKQEADRELEQKLLEEILKNSHLDLPLSLVQKQKEILLKNMQTHFKQQGLKEKEINSRLKELDKSVQNNAVAQLKVSFILDEIGQQEKIKINKEELDERIKEIADSLKQDFALVKENLGKTGSIDNLKEELQQRKILDFLVKQAEVK